MTGIERRKDSHIKVSLNERVEGDISTGFEDIRLIHRSLPELDLDKVDTSTTFFGKKLTAPLIISAITGGTPEAESINGTLANVAEEIGIGIGVGSQRIAIEQPETISTFRIVRENAPSIFVMGNFGCPQLALGWGKDEALRCIDIVDANALAIHMNPLQEAVQVDGDTDYTGILTGIKKIVEEIDIPIIMKETGCGIAYEEAIKFEEIGVAGVEISGLGGTSWAAVEHHIAKEERIKEQEQLGLALWNWGIPTAISVVETSKSTKLKIIASGGIRTGIEIAKAIILGADTVGIARPFLEKAVKGEELLRSHIKNIIQELKVVMFLVGAENIEALKKTPAIILGSTAEWLRIRGFKPESYVNRYKT